MLQANTHRVGRSNNLKLVGGGKTNTNLSADSKAKQQSGEPVFDIAKFFDTQAQEVANRAYRSTTTIPAAFPTVLVEAVIKEAEELSSTFFAQLEQWKYETKFMSSLQDIVLHMSYQRIIGLGPRVIPLILRELEENGGHWFWALQSITGENPVSPEDVGRTKRMAERWLAWGREKRYI
ncbi:MAG: hypothetical protein Q7J42_05000 [Sulfuritalea sp.]|nr:hypothetical protein [Sulfuritalea sp.]